MDKFDNFLRFLTILAILGMLLWIDNNVDKLEDRVEAIEEAIGGEHG